MKIAWDRITEHPERYQDHVYGEHEMGGTAWMTSFRARPFKGSVGTLETEDKRLPATKAQPGRMTDGRARSAPCRWS